MNELLIVLSVFEFHIHSNINPLLEVYLPKISFLFFFNTGDLILNLAFASQVLTLLSQIRGHKDFSIFDVLSLYSVSCSFAV